MVCEHMPEVEEDFSEEPWPAAAVRPEEQT